MSVGTAMRGREREKRERGLRKRYVYFVDRQSKYFCYLCTKLDGKYELSIWNKPVQCPKVRQHAHVIYCCVHQQKLIISISTHKQNRLKNKTDNIIDQISVQNINSRKLILHYYCMFQKSGMHEWNRNYWCCEFQQ